MHNTTRMMIWLAAVIFTTSLTAVAQHEKPGDEAPAHPAATYRLQYTISEIADGKRINSRNYETLMQEPTGGGQNWGQIRAGNRVPYQGKDGPSYLDVGISIDCGVRRVGDRFGLQTRFDMSSLAPEQPSAGLSMPVLRSIRFTSEATVPLNQKVLLSSGEDVSTNHRFEVELQVTQVR